MTVLQGHEALYVFDRDQAMCSAHDRQQIVDFLAGIFLATFRGADLDSLRVEQVRRSAPPDEELTQIRAGLARHGNLAVVE
jgi:hypothetical protein